jgi:hypothetical protein
MPADALTMDTPHWSRDDVTTVLVEKLGFTPDPNAPGVNFLRGKNLRLSIVDGYGKVQLAHDNPLWAATFTSSVPASIILKAVRQAATEDDYVYCRHCALRIAKVPQDRVKSGSSEVHWWHPDTGKGACSVGGTVAEPAPAED